MGPSARRSDDLEVALGHVRLGLLLTWLLAAAGVAYALLTPGAPNRAGLVATFAGAMVVGAGVSRLPLDGVLAGRWREPFFIGWSSSYLVLIAVLCLIDGGGGGGRARGPRSSSCRSPPRRWPMRACRSRSPPASG